MASGFKLRDYRQNAGLYNIWDKNAPAGTVTDDSRWKLITINTIAQNPDFTVNDFISQMRAFRDSIPVRYRGINDKWMEETELSVTEKLPKDRMWAGVSTLLGEMVLSPMAALHPYDLEKTYLRCWEVNIFDQGQSKDINSAIVAGLARALQKEADWPSIKTAMRQTDPFHFGRVPFTERRLLARLDSVDQFLLDSKGVVKELFNRLEYRTETRQWYNAWIPMMVVFSLAEITDYNPLATMQLCLEFGYDTDSYAQLAGALFGALHGEEIFPEEMRKLVRKRLIEDYNHDPEILIDILYQANRKLNNSTYSD